MERVTEAQRYAKVVSSTPLANLTTGQHVSVVTYDVTCLRMNKTNVSTLRQACKVLNRWTFCFRDEKYVF